MPAAGWKKLSDDEIRLARKWYAEDDIAPSIIASRLGRNKSFMTRLLVKQSPRKTQGAPAKLSSAKVDFLVKRLHELVSKADCKYTVTVRMLKRSARVAASERTILSALHERNIFFRKSGHGLRRFFTGKRRIWAILGTEIQERAEASIISGALTG